MVRFLRTKKEQPGQILIGMLAFMGIAATFMFSTLSWALVTYRAAQHTRNRALAIDIAEAGVEYYRWHLAHNPTDYQDGTGGAGPYVHNFFDREGNVIGTYTLTITPPPVGSTVVTIVSEGQVASAMFPTKRKVRTQLAIPSWAKFAVVANDNMRFGAGTEVFGPIHSNLGIRFDGLAHNLITSALTSYDDPDHTGGNEFAVHTHIAPTDPLPPAGVPGRPDVFESGRQFPVPTVDFTGLTADLSAIKALAQTDGKYFAPSGAQGYHIVLKTDDTFDIYQVTALTAPPTAGCSNSASQAGWGTWSILSQTFLANHPWPANNLIFVEDHLWIDGQINTARVTVAAARFPDDPTQRKSITVNANLLYTNYDGQDVIGLISQNNFNVGLVSADTIRIDAAIITQNGRVGRYYYRAPGGGSQRCSPYHLRTDLTSYGMVGSALRYGFAYTDGTGYTTRNLIYDANLLYAPPPNFPLTSSQYSTISWQEIK